jgi:phage shock protein B
MGGMLFLLVVLLAPLIALAILGGLVLAGIKILRGNPPRQSKQQWDEETRLIQELHHNLSRMEKRIEALEMILLDPERKGKDEKIL